MEFVKLKQIKDFKPFEVYASTLGRVSTNMVQKLYPEKVEKLVYTRRYDSEHNPIGWGFYPSSYQIEVLLQVMETYKLGRLLDLGAGAGTLLKAVQAYFGLHSHYIPIHGIELMPELVEVSNLFHGRGIVTQGDILEPFSSDADCVYIWDPIVDMELCKKFVANLEQCLQPGTHIVHIRAGRWIEEFLSKSEYFDQDPKTKTCQHLIRNNKEFS